MDALNLVINPSVSVAMVNKETSFSSSFMDFLGGWQTTN